MLDSELLDLYSEYLISSFGLTTATGLATLLEGSVSHDQITRFLSEPAATSAELWQRVKPHVRTLQGADGAMIVDDSIAEKPYTDENDLICWNYDHLQGRNVKGINFVSALYHRHNVYRQNFSSHFQIFLLQYNGIQMIYTITQSPALIRTVDVEEIIYDDVNEIIDEKNTAGGKGIDISRVIKELGGQSVALGFIGGYNGLELEGRLVNEGILSDFTRINDEIRSNVIIYQRKKNLQTLLSTNGPEIKPFEVSALYNKVREVPGDSYVVLGGSMSKGMNDNFFAQLITTLKEKGARVILDADGEALARGVNAGPLAS